MSEPEDIIYSPSKVQQEFHLLDCFEALYGGTAGCGKSVALLGDAFISQIYGEHERWVNAKRNKRYFQSVGWAIYFRRTFPMLEQAITIFDRMARKFDKNVRYDGKTYTYTFSCGYRFQFGHMKDPDSWRIYDSGNYSAIYLDELIQFEKQQYDGIRGRIRSGDPILRKKLRIRAATNPDAPPEGRWVKERFVDPEPRGRVLLDELVKLFDGTEEIRSRIFIPAQLSDNPDEQFRKDYEISLRTQPWHVQQARLHGDWNVVEGAFFAHEWKPEFHVVEPFDIPKSWQVFRSMDWGYKAACVVLYWAVNNDGDMVCFRELTFNHRVKEKDRKDAQLVALAIRDVEKDMGYWDRKSNSSVLRGPADYQLWAKTGTAGPSMAESMFSEGVVWDKCVKNRAQAAAEFIRRLRDIPRRHGARPAITFFSTCRYIIETIPTLKTSDSDVEVPAESNNDHWYDAICYGVMSRLASSGREEQYPKDPTDEDFDEMEIARQKKFSNGWAYGT